MKGKLTRDKKVICFMVKNHFKWTKGRLMDKVSFKN